MFDEREPKQFELAAELKMLEKQLAALKVAAPSIDRDRLMFAAGQAAAARPRWPGYIAGPSWAGSRFWPAATATMTAATVLLATMLAWRERPPNTVRPILVAPPIAEVRQPAHAAVARVKEVQPGNRSDWQFAHRPASGYLGIRQIALTEGVGAIPSSVATSGASVVAGSDERVSPATVRGLLNEFVSKSSPSI
jgi:hypothetical protein